MTKSAPALCALLAAILLASATAARAGTYVVTACGPDGQNASWHATTPPAAMETNESCSTAAPMNGAWVRDVLASPTDLTDGQGAWLRFDAPTGTSILGLSYRRWLWKVSIQDLRPELRTADGSVLETCSIPAGQDRCDLGGSGSSPVTFSGLDTSRLDVGVRCVISDPPATTCPGGGTEHGYGAVIYETAVTLADDDPPSPPTVTATGLWSGAPWQSGTTSVTTSGTDASGIRSVRVYADDQLLAEQPIACDYTHARPCDDLADEDVPIDTTQLTDGAHEIAVALVDAAGNESARARRDVVVANDPPPAPLLVLTPAHSTSPAFTASWSTSHPVPIALAHVTVCHADFCTTTTTTATHLDLTASAPGATTVAVYLEDQLGHADPTKNAVTTFTLDAPTGDPGPVPPQTGPPSVDPPPTRHDAPPPRVARIAARLRVATHVARRTVTVTTTLARTARGRVHVDLVMRGRDRHGRPWTRRLARTRHANGSKITFTVRRPAGLRRIAVRSHYDGDARTRAAVTHHVLDVQ